MPKFQCDFDLCGTIYVDAADEATAKAKMEQHVGRMNALMLETDIKMDDEGTFVSAAFTTYGLNGELIELE